MECTRSPWLEACNWSPLEMMYDDDVPLVEACTQSPLTCGKEAHRLALLLEHDSWYHPLVHGSWSPYPVACLVDGDHSHESHGYIQVVCQVHCRIVTVWEGCIQGAGDQD